MRDGRRSARLRGWRTSKDKQKRKIRDKDITGLKYFHKLDGLLEQLHDVGCERDRTDNRMLHMDQYCMLVLLSLFNPIVSSLRAVQQASELKKVQKKLGCARASLKRYRELRWRRCEKTSLAAAPQWFARPAIRTRKPNPMPQPRAQNRSCNQHAEHEWNTAFY